VRLEEALVFWEAINSPATAATIISFWTGLELTSSQLSYLKRKKDKSEGMEGKISTEDLLTYLHARDDVRVVRVLVWQHGIYQLVVR
jgi:hypothetical protein